MPNKEPTRADLQHGRYVSALLLIAQVTQDDIAERAGKRDGRKPYTRSMVCNIIHGRHASATGSIEAELLKIVKRYGSKVPRR